MQNSPIMLRRGRQLQRQTNNRKRKRSRHGSSRHIPKDLQVLETYKATSTPGYFALVLPRYRTYLHAGICYHDGLQPPPNRHLAGRRSGLSTQRIMAAASKSISLSLISSQLLQVCYIRPRRLQQMVGIHRCRSRLPHWCWNHHHGN